MVFKFSIFSLRVIIICQSIDLKVLLEICSLLLEFSEINCFFILKTSFENRHY